MRELYLYVDDSRIPLDSKWIVAKDYYEFTKILDEKGLESFKIISLDHDLGDTAKEEFHTNVFINAILEYDNIIEKTGMDCAKYMIDMSMDSNVPLPKIFIHSANPIGAANMMGIINRWLLFNDLPQNCVQARIPFTIVE